MKKIRLIAAISTFLLLFSVYANNSHAAGLSERDKWEISSATITTTCQLGGQEFGFKIKIKNAGDVKTTGEKITIKISVKYNGENLGGQDFDFTPSKTASGKTTTFTGKCTNTNYKRFTNTAGNKVLSLTYQKITWFTSTLSKDYTVKVK